MASEAVFHRFLKKKKWLGDDCAVLPPLRASSLVTVDACVSGIHFDPRFFTPEDVGHKAMSSSVSDILAMGGKPKYTLVSFGVSKKISDLWLIRCYQEMERFGKKHGIEIVGGNYSGSKEFWVSCTQIGEGKNPKLRGKAKAGDGIYVTGPIGDAALGLWLLQKKKKGFESLKRAQQKPLLPWKAAAFLGDSKEVTSMMDISDGLELDLSRLLESTKTHPVLNSIPVSDKFHEVISHFKLEPTPFLMGGGEDYQLLFTVNSKQEKKFIQRASRASLGFYKIGEVVRGAQKIRPQGFIHS